MSPMDKATWISEASKHLQGISADHWPPEVADEYAVSLYEIYVTDHDFAADPVGAVEEDRTCWDA